MIISANKLDVALSLLRNSSYKPEEIMLEVSQHTIQILYTPLKDHTRPDYVKILETFGWVYSTDEELAESMDPTSAGVWSLNG